MIHALPPAEIKPVVKPGVRDFAISAVQALSVGKVNAIVTDEKPVTFKGKAHTRVILWDWNQAGPRRWVIWVLPDGTVTEAKDITPHQTPSSGTAKTRYNGTIKIDGIEAQNGGIGLYDVPRNTIIVEGNNNFPFPDGQPIVHTKAGTEVGNGQPYEDRLKFFEAYPERLREPDALTPAGEAAAYSAATVDFFKKFFDHEGVRGTPTMIFHVVHAGFQYNNAFYANGLCECFYYGDGDWFLNPPAALTNTTNADVVAHEMAHALTTWTAGLDYWGEAGGLNEATSDIFGKSVQWWIQSGKGNIIPTPASNADWVIGKETFVINGNPTPLRYMDKPSDDGASYDYVVPALKDADPHYSSGPLNRWFYFMSVGVPSTVQDSKRSSIYVPGGYPYPVPIDRTALIWYRALQRHLLPDATYAQAADAAHQAALELYGPDCHEAHAVKWTFAAIGARSTQGLPPFVASVYPTSAQAGAYVTLTGGGFTPTTTVLIGGVVIGQYQSANEGQIRFALPAGATGGVVTVQTQYGLSKVGPVLSVEAVVPKIRELRVEPVRYIVGQPVTVYWDVEKAAKVTLNGETVLAAGQKTVATTGATQTFELVAEGVGGAKVAESVTASQAVLDLNGDGAVDCYDAISLVANWGKPGATDLNGDGTTDAADLFILRGVVQ
jgi:Zn-dependent metalloprotease